MPSPKTWTLTLTPPDAPDATLRRLPHDETYRVLRAMIAGEPAASAVERVAAGHRAA